MGIPVNSDVALLTTGTVVKGPVTYKPNLWASDTFKVGQYATLDLGTLTGEDTVSQLTVNLGNAASSNGGYTTVNIGVVGDKESTVGGSSTITIGSTYSMSSRTDIYLGCATNSGQSNIHIGDSIDGGYVGQGYVYLGSTGSASIVYAQGALVIGSNSQSITGCLYTDKSGETPTLKFYNGNEWVSLGGGASGDYLPLSGGSLSGALSIGVNVKEYQDTPLFTVEGYTESDKFNLITASGNADGHSSVVIGAQGAAEGTDIRAYGSSVSFYTTSDFSLYNTGNSGTINIFPCEDSRTNTVNIGNNAGSGGGSGYANNTVNIGNSSMEGSTTVVIGANSGYSSNGTTVKIGGVSKTSNSHIAIGDRGNSTDSTASTFITIGCYDNGGGTGMSSISIGKATATEHTYIDIGYGGSNASESTSQSSVDIGYRGITTIGSEGTTYIGPSDKDASSTVNIGIGQYTDDNALPFTVSIGHVNDVSSSAEWVGTVGIGSNFRRVSDTEVRNTTTTTLYGAVVLPVIATDSGTPITSYPLLTVGQIVFDSSTNKVYISVNDPSIGSMVWKALAFVTE